MDNQRNNANKGISLPELIVVIAILAILTAGSLTAYRLAPSWSLSRSVKSLDAAISTTKITAMSKSTGELKLWYDTTDQCVYYEVTGTHPEKFGKSDMEIQFYDASGNVKTIDGAYNQAAPLVISFERSSGAFKNTDNDAHRSPIEITKLFITYKGYNKTIEFVQETGKHRVI